MALGFLGAIARRRMPTFGDWHRFRKASCSLGALGRWPSRNTFGTPKKTAALKMDSSPGRPKGLFVEVYTSTIWGTRRPE